MFSPTPHPLGSPWDISSSAPLQKVEPDFNLPIPTAQCTRAPCSPRAFAPPCTSAEIARSQPLGTEPGEGRGSLLTSRGTPGLALPASRRVTHGSGWLEATAARPAPASLPEPLPAEALVALLPLS